MQANIPSKICRKISLHIKLIYEVNAMKHSIFTKSQLVDPITNGVINTYRHPCGLTLHIIPKHKFSKKFAGILIPYGSIHNQFETSSELVNVPAGSAHYLEHCIFSKEDNGGLLNKLSSLGANANAYTSHTHTMYYFTTVNNFLDAFELYFNAVTNPYLEEDRVIAERNIIIQELEMYEDDPDSRCFSSMIESLYLNHPVRIDIGGTKESVSQITSDHLKMIRQEFYTPKAITLTMAGDIDENEVLEFLEKSLSKYEINKDKSKYFFENEKDIILEKVTNNIMDVTAQSFLLGVKNPVICAQNPITGYEKVMMQKMGQSFFEMILGSSSNIFDSLYSEGLINDSFGFQFVCEDTYCYFVAGGESIDPVLASEKLYKMIVNQFNLKMEYYDFELQKRVAAGNFIRSFDSVEHIGMSAAIAELSDLNIFDYQEIYDKMELSKAIEAMRFVCNSDLKTVSYVLKKSEE